MRIQRSSVSILVACSLACATSPYFIAENAPASDDVTSVLLLPANFDHAPPPLLAAGTELIDEKVAAYLRERGYEVHTPKLSSVIAWWSTSAESVGGIEKGKAEAVDDERFEAARREVARLALADQPAGIVVMPTVLIREGQAYGGRLHWDGVVRPFTIDMKETNMPVTSMAGAAPGTSLRVSLYDTRPEKVFERFVGLEPINALRVMPDRKHWTADFRNDLFQDEKLVGRGVVTAFEPWLARIRPAAE